MLPLIHAIRDYQTLISGMLAVAGAVSAAMVIWHSATLPLKAQLRRDEDLRRRQIIFTCATLSTEWRVIHTRARQVEATITVVVAANDQVNDHVRSKCYLNRHAMVQDWTYMSVLETDMLHSIMALYRLIDDHNFDISRAGGAFGAESFRQSLRERLHKIQLFSNELSGKADAFMRLSTINQF